MNNKINGINYELIENPSSKENLVFVHGSGCNHKFLRPLAKMLTDYNCYLIDLPDHGDSDNRNCTKAEDYIEAVAGFVSTLDNATMVGHSLGGAVCLGVAAKCIPSVKRSVILSSGAKFDKLDEKVLKMVGTKKVNWPHLLYCLGSLTNLDVLLSVPNLEPIKVLLKDLDMAAKLDLENVISNINIPALIMVGTDDILSIPEYSGKLHAAIKNSKLVTVPNVRHMLPVAKKKYVAQLIKDFMID